VCDLLNCCRGKCYIKILSEAMPAVPVMANGEDLIQVLDYEDNLGERFREFYKIFFDPCHSHRRVVIGGIRILAQSDNLFTEAVKKLRLLKTASEAEDSTDCGSVTAGRLICIAEDSAGQPDIVRSVEGLEQVSLPTSPDIVPEMDERCEPGCSRNASLNRSLRQTGSYERPPKSLPVQVERPMSDSVALRRLSSAYGSQEQNLPALGRYEDDEDQSLITEQPVQMTPPRTEVVALSSRMRASDDDEKTAVLPAVVQLSHPSSLSLRMDLPSAESSGASNIPTMVTGTELTDEDEFKSVYFTCTDERFVTAADGLEQEQSTAARQPIAYPDFCAFTADLENRIIRLILIALLQENCSPNFVRSVAESFIMSVSEAAATGRCCSFPLLYYSVLM